MALRSVKKTIWARCLTVRRAHMRADKILLILFVSLLSSAGWAKRLAPAKIKPVVEQGNEFSYRVEKTSCKKSPTCGMQVFLVSKNVASGKLNWERELYQKAFDPKMETDVQTIYPKSLKLKEKNVIAIDEKGSKYIVKSATGDLVIPLKSIIYPANK